MSNGDDKPAAFEGSHARSYAEGPPRQVPGFASLHRMTSMLLAERVPANGHVLVVGAGGGLELKALADEHPGWTLTGVDPSADMLRVAQENIAPHLARIHLHEGYVDTAPAGPFDGATCLLTLHFVPREQRLSTLQQIHRRLRPGAPFIAAHISFTQQEPQAHSGSPATSPTQAPRRRTSKPPNTRSRPNSRSWRRRRKKPCCAKPASPESRSSMPASASAAGSPTHSGAKANGATIRAHPALSHAPGDGRLRRMTNAAPRFALLLILMPCCANAATEVVQRAVQRAHTSSLPACSVYVDAASPLEAGTAAQPYRTIAAAVAATSEGAVICVAQGDYPENLTPGEKAFTLAGGFQSGSGFTVRDSATYVSKAAGNGTGSFIRYDDPAPRGAQLTVIDGFEITGYAQAIRRDVYYSQSFDITNNNIHDNSCADDTLAGAGFALNNISGRIEGNVFRNNSCGRGGAGFLNDSANENTVTIAHNRIEENSGTEPETSHGGALYLFTHTLTITGNSFARNTVTRWGGGLYVGAAVGSGQETKATISWNVYTQNRAGISGGGMFCDDGATCLSAHEIYYANCGGNILLDSGGAGGATRAKFDRITNVGALAVGCEAPGAGVQIDRAASAPDSYVFSNAIFWNNAPGMDFAANCDADCDSVRVRVETSLVQTDYANNGLAIQFAPDNIAPVDPLFADPATGDFHLRSSNGRWTPQRSVQDPKSSPLLDSSPLYENANDRTELGAYGNSFEASSPPEPLNRR